VVTAQRRYACQMLHQGAATTFVKLSSQERPWIATALSMYEKCIRHYDVHIVYDTR
jgi:hypothetical protein